MILSRPASPPISHRFLFTGGHLKHLNSFLLCAQSPVFQHIIMAVHDALARGDSQFASAGILPPCRIYPIGNCHCHNDPQVTLSHSGLGVFANLPHSLALDAAVLHMDIETKCVSQFTLESQSGSGLDGRSHVIVLHLLHLLLLHFWKSPKRANLDRQGSASARFGSVCSSAPASGTPLCLSSASAVRWS